MSSTIFALIPLLYTIASYYFLNAGKESFLLFCPTSYVPDIGKEKENYLTLLSHVYVKKNRWPFDWKTPLGYLVVWIAQCAGIASIVVISVGFYGFVLGSCWLFIVIAKDITKDVTAFNNAVRTLKNNRDHAKLMETLRDIIQIYSNVKQ